MNILLQLAFKKIYTELFGSGFFVSSLKLIMLCLSTINVLALCILLNSLSIDIAHTPFIYIFNFFIFIMVLFKDFIPSFKKVVIYDVPHLPLRAFHKIVIWFSSNHLSYFNIVLTANLFVFLVSPLYSFIDFLSSIMTMLLAIFISFIIRYNLDYNYQRKSFYIGLSIFLIACYSLFLICLFLNYFEISFQQYLYFLIVSSLSFTSLVFTLFNIRYKEVINNEQYQQALFSNKKINALISNRLVLSIMAGFFFKVILLSINAYTMASKGEYLFNSEFLFALVLAPVVVFSYGLNNLFSFNSGLYYNILQRSGTSKLVFFQHFLFYCSIFILFDLILTLAILYFMSSASEIIKHINYYITSVIFLIPLGLLGSLYFPIKIEKKLNFFANTKMYTNPIISVISIVGVLLIYHFQSSYAYIFVTLAAIIILFYISKNFRTFKYKFISQLYF